MPHLYGDGRSRSPAGREGARAEASLRHEVNAQRANIGRICSALDILKSDVSGQECGLALENQAHNDCLRTIQHILFLHGQGSRLGECQIALDQSTDDKIASLDAPPPQIALMDSVDKRKMLASWIFGGQLEAANDMQVALSDSVD